MLQIMKKCINRFKANVNVSSEGQLFLQHRAQSTAPRVAALPLRSPTHSTRLSRLRIDLAMRTMAMLISCCICRFAACTVEFVTVTHDQAHIRVGVDEDLIFERKLFNQTVHVRIRPSASRVRFPLSYVRTFHDRVEAFESGTDCVLSSVLPGVCAGATVRKCCLNGRRGTICLVENQSAAFTEFDIMPPVATFSVMVGVGNATLTLSNRKRSANMATQNLEVECIMQTYRTEDGFLPLTAIGVNNRLLVLDDHTFFGNKMIHRQSEFAWASTANCAKQTVAGQFRSQLVHAKEFLSSYGVQDTSAMLLGSEPSIYGSALRSDSVVLDLILRRMDSQSESSINHEQT